MSLHQRPRHAGPAAGAGWAGPWRLRPRHGSLKCQSEAGFDAPAAGPGGRRRRFQKPADGPIVPMAWLLLRNEHIVYELCPELKGASFETLGAKVAELGPPSTSTSPLSWHESRRRRCGARRARRRTTFRGHVLDRALCRRRERPPAERSAVAATCAATGAGGEQQPGRDAHVLCLWVCQ